MKLSEYIESANPVVRESISNLQDVEIDDFSEDGANGYVFFGEHKVFRTRIAVKYYTYSENAHEEVALIKKITSPYILKVWDAHEIEDGWAYFITEEQRHGTLEDLLSSGNLDTSKAINITRGILKGISVLHGTPHYLLHRDLKPANILIDDTSSPIIADFGSLRRLPQGEDSVVASQHSALYRPPESYNGGRYYCCSDVYQIGMLLFQLLGGNLSYNAFSYMTKKEVQEYKQKTTLFDKSKFEDLCLQRRATDEKLLNYSSLPPYTDKKLIRIIKMATKSNPEKRLSSSTEFLNKLHDLGQLPNWKIDGDTVCCDYQKNCYRIVKSKVGEYKIEKRFSDKWKRLHKSIDSHSLQQAVDQLSNRLAT